MIKRNIQNLVLFIVVLVGSMSCNHHYWSDGYYSSTTTYTETDYYEEDEYITEDTSSGSSGSLELWSSSEKGHTRDFFGSYKLSESDSSCGYNGAYDPDIDLPTYIDVYEYGSYMDFENGSGDLLWNAYVSGDYEFDFYTHAYDWYGDAMEFPCQCDFVDVGSKGEFFECSCAPSSTDQSCMMYYDLI